MTESIPVLSILMPDALAKLGLEPTAVMAVPVFGGRNAHIREGKKGKEQEAAHRYGEMSNMHLEEISQDLIVKPSSEMVGTKPFPRQSPNHGRTAVGQ